MLEKIQSNLKPYLRQHWFTRWVNVREVEKVVGRAEGKDGGLKALIGGNNLRTGPHRFLLFLGPDLARLSEFLLQNWCWSCRYFGVGVSLA